MFNQLGEYGVIPVIAVQSVDEGLHICEALSAGGLPAAEITFRTAAAEEAIRAAVKRFPKMIIGAGTVLQVEDLERAIAAGACFAVAPGCNPVVVRHAVERSFAFAPGVCTPSDVEKAVACGVTDLKFFPAEACGGVKMLKALIGPYGHLGLRFCPTGGINPENMSTYLALPQAPVVGGTWLAKKDLVAAGDWQQISERARQAVAAARTVKRGAGSA